MGNIDFFYFLQKVQKSSSESLGRLESACESGTTDLLRWRSDGAASAEAFRTEMEMLVRKCGKWREGGKTSRFPAY